MRSVDSSSGEVIEFKRDTIRHVVDDLVRLEDMNIPTIMMNLRERANKDLIYTNVGSILVSVNPYQLLPIYTPAVMEQYRRRLPNLPPHPYNVAHQCYQALIEEKRNQAILVSGESGAGKTEAVKVVLQYLAEIAGSSSGVEQKILLANPMCVLFTVVDATTCRTLLDPVLALAVTNPEYFVSNGTHTLPTSGFG